MNAFSLSGSEGIGCVWKIPPHIALPGTSTRVTGNGEVTVRAEAACNRLPASLFPKSLNNPAIESGRTGLLTRGPLFRPDRGIARAALSLETRAHHQHGFRRASGRHLDFDDLQSAKNYRALKASSRSKLCNIPVYARARPPAARHGGSPQIACIPACRYTLW